MGIVCSNQPKKNSTFKNSNWNSVEYINPQSCQYDNQNANEDYQCAVWNYHQDKWCLVKFQIIITQQQEVKYIFDGQILRVEQLKDSFARPEVFTNLEQIENLQWCGNFGQKDLQKVGKWTANWRRKNLVKIVKKIFKILYSEDGSKQGIWKEITKNYCSQCQIYEIGEYQNNQKIGLWNYIYKNKKIAGGLFNSQFQKHGKWIELSEGFNKNEQVTFSCEYKNGQKVGIYVIWNRGDRNSNNKQIGGGLYSERDSLIKSGNWVEISDGLNTNSKVTYHGRYKNGKRVGRWDIMCQNEKIGGGEYNESGDGIQQGNWVEIWNEFNPFSQVTYHGSYKNGKKVGRWDILQKINHENQKIGGGENDESGDGIQQGNWVEIWNEFNPFSQVTYHGSYKNGKKVGQWDIQYKKIVVELKEFIQLRNKGGGQDDEGGDELLDGFNNDSKGLGTEVDQLVFKKQFVKKTVDVTICGGSYDNAGDGIKMGNWTEIWDGFNCKSQVIYYGQYNYGKKVGIWTIWYSNDLDRIYHLQIGGGEFDETNYGIKFGIWGEIKEGLNYDSSVTYHGEYKKGIKYGRWDILTMKDQNIFELTSSITFDEKGTQVFKKDYSNILFNGKNLFGYKIGRWDIIQGNEKIGGGQYEKGYKQGDWVEISDKFTNKLQVTQNGEYIKGKKVGVWREMKRDNTKLEVEFTTLKEIKYDN